jgi:hypothetical protein
MKEPDRLHGLDVEQQMPAPAYVGAERRGEVDDSDQTGRCGGKAW